MARSYNIDLLFNIINRNPSGLSGIIREITQLRGSVQAGSREFVAWSRALNVLRNPIAGTSFLNNLKKSLEDVKNGVVELSNTPIGLNIDATLSKIDSLISSLKTAQRIAFSLGKTSVFEELSSQIAAAEELSAAIKTRNRLNKDYNRDLSEQKGLIDSQVESLTKNFSKIQQQFTQLRELGSVLPNQAQLLDDLNEIINDLEKIRTEKVRLGQDPTTINVKLAKAKELFKDVSGITGDLDDAARREYEIKLSFGQTLKKVNSDLRNLEKNLEKAVQQRDIRLVAKIEAETTELEDKINTIRQAAAGTGDLQLLRETSKSRAAVAGFRKELNTAQASLPTGFFGYFKRLSTTVSEAREQFKRQGTVARTTAGALRLIGTSAFLVGGQFRTLGFGASAAGNILQTYAPLLNQITAQFGALSPIILGIGAAFAAIAVQAAAFAVAIVSLVDIGFRFNNQFNKVQNSVSAVAREFFNFSSNIRPATESMDAGAKSALEFEVAGAAVAKELQALQLEATRTEFTAQDLFEAFQSTTSALGNLSPSLEASRKLTGLFARTASIARVPIAQLGSSISQIVAGTGRVTNPLVRDVFNKLTDSKGIALTAKRIRELRAEGGTVLFDELTLALKRFTDGVGELQAERTLSGAASNITDLLQIFAGRSTQEAFSLVIQSLVKVRDSIVSIDKVTGNINFTPPFQKLLQTASAFITRISEDVIGVIDKILNYFEELGSSVENNYEEFVVIYELLKDILNTVGSIVADFLEFVGITSEGATGLEVIQFLLLTLDGYLIALRIKWNLIAIAVLGITRIVLGLGQALGKIIATFTGNTALEDWSASAGEALARNIGERVESIADATVGFVESVKKVTRSDQFKKDLIKDGKTVVEKVTTTPQRGARQDQNDARASQRSTLRLLEQYNQFYKSLLDLNKETNDVILQQAQQRIKREQDLINAQVNLGLKSQLSAQKEINALRLEGISNEIAARNAALNLLKADENRSRLFAAESQRAINTSSKAKQEAADADNRIEEESLQRVNEKLKLIGDERKLTQEISDLEYQRLQTQLEFLQLRAQAFIELRKESAELAAAVSDIEYPNSFEALTDKFKLDILNAAENYSRINSEILNLTKNLNNLEADDKKRLENLENYNRLLIKQLALRQRQATFEQLQNIAGRELDSLSRNQALIQRDVDLGRISSIEGLQKITKLNYEYGDALEIVLARLKELSGENPTIDQERQIFDLEQRILDLKGAITEGTLINASNNIRDSLVDTFVSIQENAGNAVSAIQSFAQSVLSTFRRLLAEKIVRDLFSTLFPKEGQTAGRAGGLVSSLLRSLGLSPESNIQQNVTSSQLNPEVAQRVGQEVTKTETFKDLSSIESQVREQLNTASSELAKILEPVTQKMGELYKNIEQLPKNLNIESFNQAFLTVATKFRDEFLNITTEVAANVKSKLNSYINDLLGIKPLSRASSGPSNIVDTGFSGGAGSTSGRTARRSSFGTSARLATDSSGSRANNQAPATSNTSTNVAPQFNGVPVAGDILGQPSTPTAKASGIRGYLDSIIPPSVLGNTVKNFLLGKSKEDTSPRQKEITRIVRENDVLRKLIPAKSFQNFTTDELRTFSLGDYLGEFSNAINARLAEEYDNYNNLERLSSSQAGLLKASGLSLDKNGKFTSQPLKVISRVTGDQLLNRSNNDIIVAGNLASQVIADIRGSASLSREITDLNLKISSLEQTSRELSVNGVPQNARAKESIYASNIEIKRLQNEVVQKTLALSELNRRLSTLDYNPTEAFKELQTTQSPYVLKKAQGGAVFGKGGPTDDSIPAMLSNGEYVVRAQSVKKLGIPFFNKLNNINSYANGGSLIDTLYNNPSYKAPTIDPSKFNYFGGAANLIKGPAPIIEAALNSTRPKRRKRLGLFGSIISGIAPFLKFIPGIGPALSLGAGALGGALSGSENGFASGLLSGIFGGLSNLGGFSKSTGSLGTLSRFFGEGGKGAGFLSLLSFSGIGNIGNTLGQGLSGLLSNLPTLKNISNAVNIINPTTARDIIAKGVEKNLPFSNNNLSKILTSNLIKSISKKNGGIIGSLPQIFKSVFSNNTTNRNSLPSSGKNNSFINSLSLALNSPNNTMLEGSKNSMFGFSKKLIGSGLKIGKYQKGGPLPIQDTSWILGALKTLGLDSSKSKGTSPNKSPNLLNLALLLGSTFLPSLLSGTKKPSDFSITDPDTARKNRFGSAYDSLVEYGIIGEYKYQKETLDALRRGSKWMPIEKQSSGSSGLFNLLFPFVLSSASSLFKGSKAKAMGGLITGPGTGTSDSIPAWLSAGEYVIKASSVKSLGTDILDSINEGRFKFASGGVAGEGVNTLPDISLGYNSSENTPVTVNSNTKVVNVLDPDLLGDYLQTNEGTKLLLNVISRRSREVKAIINR